MEANELVARLETRLKVIASRIGQQTRAKVLSERETETTVNPSMRMQPGGYPVHYPTRDLLRRLGLLKQGVTIFIITQNDFNTEKNPSPAVTSTPGNMQSRHAPWEPNTSRGEIFFCILPYLNISDFSWLKVFVIQYTIPLGTC